MIDDVCARLAGLWRAPVVVEEVLADRADRVVLATRRPDGTSVVVKGDLDAARLRQEHRAQIAAASAGVPVAAVTDAAFGPLSVLVSERIAARKLADDAPEAPWREVGRTLRLLHDHQVDERDAAVLDCGRWWERLSDWLEEDLARCAASGMFPPRLLDRAHTLIARGLAEAAPPALVLVHGDCRPPHWLMAGDRVAAVIDFGDAALGDAVWDLAVMSLWNPDRLQALLDGYQPTAAVLARMEEVFVTYTMLRHLVAVPWMRAAPDNARRVIAALEELVEHARPRLGSGAGLADGGGFDER